MESTLFRNPPLGDLANSPPNSHGGCFFPKKSSEFYVFWRNYLCLVANNRTECGPYLDVAYYKFYGLIICTPFNVGLK